MLLLGRRAGESIRVGDVVITVLSIRGTRVTLGIDAPAETTIARSEIDVRDQAIASHYDSGQLAALRGCRRVLCEYPSPNHYSAWLSGYDSVPLTLRGRAPITGPIPAELLAALATHIANQVA